jgi:hypothetical protein
VRNRCSIKVLVLVLGCSWPALVVPAASDAAWHEPVGGPQPINVASDQDATFPSLASVGGSPYVAWQEGGGSEAEIHVAQLNGAGTAWQLVGGSVSTPGHGGAQPSLTDLGGVPYVAFTEFDDSGVRQIHVARLAPSGTSWERIGEADDPAKPINESASRDAFFPSLAAVGGIPYVAWHEGDGTNTEIRVARLNGTGTGWEQPVDGASPINNSSLNNAEKPSLAGIGGVPYVAWDEFDGGNFEIRVARLNGTETDWDPVGETANPSSPINQTGGGDAREASLTGIGGVPYVAWREATPPTGTQQVRVARLRGDELAWDKVAGGLSPINKSSSGQATDPSLIGIGGVPYVAWSEAIPSPFAAWVARLNADGTAWEKVPDSATPVDPDVNLADPSLVAIGGIPYVAYKDLGATNQQARVSRLEPELQVAAAPSGTGATLIASVRSFDLPYQVGFEFGPGGFTSETPAQTTSGDTDLITQSVMGLSPSTTYDFRAFALAGLAAPRVLGAGGQFTTAAASPTPTSPAAAPQAAPKKKCKKGHKLKHGRCVKKKRH